MFRWIGGVASACTEIVAGAGKKIPEFFRGGVRRSGLDKAIIRVPSDVLYGASEGLSILIALVMVAFLLVVSVGVATMVTESTRQSANIIAGTKAYYAAESGIEMGLFINHELMKQGKAVGANKSGSMSVGDDGAVVRWKVQGTTSNLFEKTVNGSYIIPFPWTGNAPWHGDGSVRGAGGCDPEKPPGREGSGDSKWFKFPGIDNPNSLNEIDHPCNWNTLRVGEKAVIPLFGVKDGVAANYTEFTLKLRAPCKDDKEFCLPGERMEINCFDKGSGERRCGFKDSNASFRNVKGEVVVAWEVDGDDGSSLLPKQNIKNNNEYKPDDSQLFEGKINKAKKSITPFVLLDQTADGILGGDTGIVKTIQSFLTSLGVDDRPVLKVSVVGSLVGCSDQVDCSYDYDSPENKLNYTGPHGIPYLEYQIVLPNASPDNPPANVENIITAEGQFGAFVRTMQVKVPNDNSTLEYVIQQ